MYYAEAEMQCLKHLFANILSTKAYIQAARNVDRWMLVYCYCYAMPENKNTSTPVLFCNCRTSFSLAFSQYNNVSTTGFAYGITDDIFP